MLDPMIGSMFSRMLDPISRHFLFILLISLLTTHGNGNTNSGRLCPRARLYTHTGHIFHTAQSLVDIIERVLGVDQQVVAIVNSLGTTSRSSVVWHTSVTRP